MLKTNIGDDTDTFTSPAIYRTAFNFQDILKTKEGTYYYKVRAWTLSPEQDGISSEWSNTVDITVDFPHQPPPEGPDAGYIHGLVYDSSTNAPLPAAKITVKGVEGAVLTDGKGKFIFPIIDYPRENKKSVIVTIKKPNYTYAQRRVIVTTTRDVSVDAVYLTLLDPQTTLITSDGGTAANSTGTIEVTFPQGAVSGEIEVNATEYKRGKELPAPLPETSFFTYALDLRPDGASFSQPVIVRIANSRGFAAGTPIPVGYYNKNEVRWEAESMGEVTADGQWVEFEVSHFSPRDCNLPVSAPSGARRGRPRRISRGRNNNQRKDAKDPGVSIRSGTLILEHSLPLIKSLGQSQQLAFTYFSTSAQPSNFIGTETETISWFTPETSGWILNIEGMQKEVKFRGVEDKARQPYLFNAQNARELPLSTGSYSYSLRLSNDYRAEYFTTSSFGGPPEEPTGVYSDELKSLTTSVTDRIIINNQNKSPFGVGWTLNQLQRLHFDPDGRVLLTNGEGSAIIFSPSAEATSLLPFVSGLNYPSDLVFDSQGNLFVSDKIADAIYRVTPEGNVSTFTTEISNPTYLAIDIMDNLYVSHSTDDTVFKVTPQGEVSAYVDVKQSQGLAIDKQGNLFVADGVAFKDGVIVKVLPDGSLEDFAIGFKFPSDIIFGPAGNLFVLDEGAIFKVTPQGEVSTFAEGFGFLERLAFDEEGNLFVSDISTGIIYRITPEGTKKVFTSEFAKPTGLAFDKLGNFFAADVSAEGIIYKINPSDDAFLFLPPAGDFSQLVHNLIDNTYTRTLKDGIRINFDSLGLHTSTVDRNGNTTTYTYDNVNNDAKAEELISITNPAGGVTEFIYDSQGYLSQVTDPAGRDTSFTINQDGDLISIITPDGALTTYNYDSQHLINSVTGPNNNTTQYTTTSQGRYNQIIFPTAEEINFTPSELQGLINDLPQGAGTPNNPANPVPANIPDLLTNGRGQTTTYQTNKFGALIKEEDPLGNVSITKRDEDSNPTQITRANGSQISMSYDGRGNLLSSTEESINAATFFTYEPNFNQVTSIIDPEGNKTQIDYDQKGNPIKTIDAQNNETLMIYDERGLLTSITDSLSNQTTFTYDTLTGNLLTTTDPLGNTTTLFYDTAGNIIISTDAQGRTTQYEYDPMNRLTNVIDADGKSTYYEYDSNGNLTMTTNAKNQKTTFEYDDVNQLIKVINPLGQEKAFTYDLNRNLLSTTDAKNQTINFTYDAADQLIQKELPDDTVHYTYDNVGKLISLTDTDSSLTFTYDLVSRLTSASTADSPLQPEVTTSYTYDKNNNRITLAGPTDTTNYTYDNLNRLTQLTNPDSQTTTYVYDNIGRLINKTLPNNITTNYTYDAASQLTGLQSSAVNYQYNYDKAGNRTSMTNPLGLNTYTYDTINRLTQAKHPIVSTESFAYDNIGNRTTSHLSSSYTYNQANRLLQDNTYTYEYDLNGSLIQKQNKSTMESTTYAYNAENQLTRINFPDSTYAAYAYDGLGKRIQKDTDSTITRYIYDNEDILLEYNGSNSLIAAYTHGPGIDEPISMERGGQSYYYHTDALGSIVALTNTTGTVVQSSLYDSFGNIINQIGSLTNPYTYTGREYDDESGLYYYRARYYDPLVGRFLQEDPLGFEDGINVYVYVENQPINKIDPHGLRGEKKIKELLDKKFGNKLTESEKQKIADFTGKRISILLGLKLLNKDPKVQEEALKELEKKVRRALKKADQETKKTFNKLDKLRKDLGIESSPSENKD